MPSTACNVCVFTNRAQLHSHSTFLDCVCRKGSRFTQHMMTPVQCLSVPTKSCNRHLKAMQQAALACGAFTTYTYVTHGCVQRASHLSATLSLSTATGLYTGNADVMAAAADLQPTAHIHSPTTRAYTMPTPTNTHRQQQHHWGLLLPRCRVHRSSTPEASKFVRHKHCITCTHDKRRSQHSTWQAVQSVSHLSA